METKKLKITVSGRVQGVGFRYFTYNSAVRLDIKGYVKNLYDGNVEIVAIGEKNNMNAFLEYIKKGPSFAIVEKMDIKEYNANKYYNDFKIIY